MDTHNPPLLSIITVCYNAAHTIERTLESIDSQTFGDYEHIIIDGASTDSTATIVHAHPDNRRSFFSEADRGLYDAMNKGLEKATGTYLIFLNSGDRFHCCDTLRIIADAIAANSATMTPGVIYGQTDIVDDQGHRIGTRHLSAPADLKLEDFAQGMVVCHQAFVVLRRIAGYYYLRYRYSADYDWCIRCLQHSRLNVGLVDTVLVDYLDGGLTTGNRMASLWERFRIMAHYFGLVRTTARHFKFALRWYKRNRK